MAAARGQLKPINDRRQVRLWFRDEPLPVQPRKKITDAFMGLVPSHLWIERRRIGAEVVCCADLREQINRVIESKHRIAGAPRRTRYVEETRFWETVQHPCQEFLSSC
jgi:hypothetical protein